MTNVKTKKYVEKVLNNYTPKETSKLEELKKLDRKTRKNATVFAYIFGSISSLVFGLGMCLAMKIILDMMIPGIIIGLVGMFLMGINYSIYKALVKKAKVKYSEQIINISNELLNN